MRLPTNRRLLPAALAILGVLALAGCGDEQAPFESNLEEDTAQNAVLGLPALATKNTTRVAGADSVATAAAVAQAVYPGQEPAQRPYAVSLVDRDNWQGGIAASVLMAPPLGAPVLLTDGGDVPGPTSQALQTLQPRSLKRLRGLEAFVFGNAASPGNLKTQAIEQQDPYELAAAIDQLRQAVSGRASDTVVVASGEQPAYALPAAAYAAKSGTPVLFTARNSLPAATRQAIRRHKKPAIYVLGPKDVISTSVEKSLGKLGPVARVGGTDPISNAVAYARYSDGSFGWGVRDPGHGLTISTVDRPLDAAASAALGGSGTYAPLLLTDSATELPAALENFLLDIQPGYRFDPTRGVYNHAWLLGDEAAIDLRVQSRIDQLTQIVKIRPKPEPDATTQPQDQDPGQDLGQDQTTTPQTQTQP